jgi:hypothetical protein
MNKLRDQKNDLAKDKIRIVVKCGGEDLGKGIQKF